MVVVLDEIDFLLPNDGSELLYFLSRCDTSDNIGVVTLSSNSPDLGDHVGDRVWSSLHPRSLHVDPYMPDDIYRILADRGGDAVGPSGIHREALRFVAEETVNAGLAVTWIQTAITGGQTPVTEPTVDRLKSRVADRYAGQLLDPFTAHHHLVLNAVTSRTRDSGDTVRAGEVYSEYETLCKRQQRQRLSNRRISDFLKHLELLDLIDADYQYGGSTGKTREIRLNDRIF